MGCNEEDVLGPILQQDLAQAQSPFGAWHGMACPGGSLVQKGGQTSRARLCSVGHRCICMGVLVWVRSVLLEQVRSLSPLPADVRALPSRLLARGWVSVWVLLNQEMFPPGNVHSVSRTCLVLAESETN